MKLQIIRIADRGVPNNERLHLTVLADATLSYYVVLKSTIMGNEGVMNSSLLSFWFPTVQVKAGDQVILYTKTGKNSSEKTTSGNTNHFFYWGLNNTLWNSPTDCAVLIEVNSWVSSSAGA